MVEYPFATELITNTRGRVSKVIMDFQRYRQLLAELEDAGLYRAMKKVAGEKPVSHEKALASLEEE